MREPSIEARADARQALVMLALFVAALAVVFFTLVQPRPATDAREDARAAAH